MEGLDGVAARLDTFLRNGSGTLPGEVHKLLANLTFKPHHNQAMLSLGSLGLGALRGHGGGGDLAAEPPLVGEQPPVRQSKERRFPRRPPQQQPGTAAGGVEERGKGGGRRKGKARVTHNVHRTDVVEETTTTASGVVCVEVQRGRRRVYSGRANAAEGWEGFEVVTERVPQGHALGELAAGYLLPQGYPDSVAPQYASYMGWRGIQYFFGGAMSVFTTRSLLGALGVGGRHQGEAAAAINWVVKDGAGRLGRFLFARWGRALDCELKQFRLAGDLLMEAGAALELATAAAPRAFLPLACAANLAKNLAAVAASSTRAPIYRTFARANNLADVTAKGESVANLADIVGTLFGIALARANLPMVPCFCALSCGYLYASRREVDSVELPYLNRARLSYSVREFLTTGQVPAPAEANTHEPLLPWGSSQRVVMGARVEDACSGPTQLASTLEAWQQRPYALTYRPDTRKVYVLLHEGAGTSDILESAFSAHYLLHKLDTSEATAASTGATMSPASGNAAALAATAAGAPQLYHDFADQAVACGWKLHLTMLNPTESRLRTTVLADA